MPGMGMLDNGKIAGLVTEVTEHESLVLPIIHLHTQWSVRLGNEGAIGRMVWYGQGTEYATLKDIPLSELIIPGDPVVTTGFQGTFPSGLEVGKVEEVLVTPADKFQSVTVKLGADYKHIHYVEFLMNSSSEIVDSLINLAPE
jgi:rod shape-determining protein MreC